MSDKPRCVVLFSGGLDSTTTVAIAKRDGYTVHALTVSYGQTHDAELAASRRVSASLGIDEHRVLEIDLASLAASALTRTEIEVPLDRSIDEISTENSVPATYVPARNTVLLSLALAWAESLAARDIFLGVNVLDASGYPDCRPEFISSFESLANVATALGVGGARIQIHAPLIKMTKADIVTTGVALCVDYSLTHSCYAPAADDGACGRCDACTLRAKGFAEAGIPDPTHYSA